MFLFGCLNIKEPVLREKIKGEWVGYVKNYHLKRTPNKQLEMICFTPVSMPKIKEEISKDLIEYSDIILVDKKLKPFSKKTINFNIEKLYKINGKLVYDALNYPVDDLMIGELLLIVYDYSIE